MVPFSDAAVNTGWSISWLGWPAVLAPSLAVTLAPVVPPFKLMPAARPATALVLLPENAFCVTCSRLLLRMMVKPDPGWPLTMFLLKTPCPLPRRAPTILLPPVPLLLRVLLV